MNDRADALITASSIIAKLPDITERESKDSVITTGKLNVYPNGANVIPGKVSFTIDVRSSQDQNVKNMIANVKDLISKFKRGDIQIDIKQKKYIKSKSMDLSIQELLADKSEELNINHCVINSGAGHDAMVLSDVTKTGMVFIPSKNGLSHHPEEYSTDQDIVNSVNIIFEAVKNLMAE